MAITGSTWHTLSLASLIPELNPNDPNSFASQMNETLDDTKTKITQTTGRLSDLLNRTEALLDQIDGLSQDLDATRRKLDNFITNAANTGIYVRIVGSEGDITNNFRLGDAVTAALLTERADPNRPSFTDNTAFIAGFMLVLVAPTFDDLITDFDNLSGLIPIFGTLLPSLGGSALDTALAPFKFLDDLASANTLDGFNSFLDSFKGGLPTSLSIDQKSLDELNPFNFISSGDVLGSVDKLKGFGGKRWHALRITDLIPMLDPTKNSPAKSVLDGANKLLDQVNGALGTAGNLSSQLTQLNGAINLLGNQANRLTNDAQNIINATLQTGFYFHLIGFDFSLHTNDDFASAVRAALDDETDLDRPNVINGFLASMVVVTGGPDPDGLQDEFNRLSKVFGGIGDLAKGIKKSGSEIGELF